MSACLGISVCSCVSVLVCGEEGMGTGEKKNVQHIPSTLSSTE